MSHYVYILLCFDGALYTGCTDNLIKRFERHKHGGAPATKDRRPLKLQAYFVIKNKYTAFNYETTDTEGMNFICKCGSANCRKMIRGNAWENSEFVENNKGFLSWYIEQKVNNQNL